MSSQIEFEQFAALVDGACVHGSVYVDPRVFEAERNRIFDRTWICLGHEAELPNAGDFKTAELSMQPVVVIRQQDGQIGVVQNRCRHRGAQLCDVPRGNIEKFVCPYHGWAYDQSGRFLGAPMPDGYDRQLLRSGALSLLPAPRVGLYNGFIFASLAATGPSLEEHLGEAATFIDAFVGDGFVANSGRNIFDYPGNWKLATENVVDGYHLPFIHESYFEVLRGRRPDVQPSSMNPSLRSWDLGNGHGMLDFREYDADGIIRESPKTNVAGTMYFNLFVFPNLALAADHFRLITPRGVAATRLELVHVVPASADEHERETRIRRHEDFYGPGGFAMPDDLEVAFRRVTGGMRATFGNDQVYMGRGLNRERIDERGRRWGHITDETPQRGFYREWARQLAA